MKTMTLTATPSSSSRTPSTPGREGRGYFPGCRKDTNCHCDMCLASIHATLDLVPSKLSSSSRPPSMRPFTLTDPVTPSSTPEPRLPPMSPPTKSIAKSRVPEKKSIIKKASFGGKCWIMGKRLLGLLGCLLLIWAVDSGVVGVVFRGFGPKLSPEAMRGFQGVSKGAELRVRLEILQKKIEEIVGEKVCDCSSMDYNWELIQGGSFFFHWRCVIYQSVAEDVSVWGSPLRTSGMLPTSFSARYLTLLSGRITEWSEGRMVSTSRFSNSSSWTSEKLSLVAVQLEENTWVLEYKRSPLFQDPGLLPAAWEMVKVRAIWTVKKMKQQPWRLSMLPVYPEREFPSPVEKNSIHPT